MAVTATGLGIIATVVWRASTSSDGVVVAIASRIGTAAVGGITAGIGATEAGRRVECGRVQPQKGTLLPITPFASSAALTERRFAHLYAAPVPTSGPRVVRPDR